MFGSVYTSSFQYAQSFDKTANVVKNGRCGKRIFARNGKQFGFRYTFMGIEDDFKPKSGFLSRVGIVHAAADHRTTWYADRGSAIEAVTGDLLLDDTWQYQHFVHQGDAQDKKFHVSGSVALRGGWNVGAGVYWETFGWDRALYANYRILTPNGDTLPFTGVGTHPESRLCRDDRDAPVEAVRREPALRRRAGRELLRVGAGQHRLPEPDDERAADDRRFALGQRSNIRTTGAEPTARSPAATRFRA